MNSFFCGSRDISNLSTQGLEVLYAWKLQLKAEASNTKFDFILSIDDGDEDMEPSVTVRFNAIREQGHCITPSKEALDRFEQPILMESVNDQ